MHARFHNQNLTIDPLWVDKFPVTNDLYQKYLEESQYTPVDTEHWLQHWSGQPPTRAPADNIRTHPVTFVPLSDARAYCEYYGKRLPRVQEWQWVAGQAVDGSRLYPWGNSPPSNRTCPVTGGGSGVNRTIPGPEDVDAHPAGCSPHGVCDAIGNTWEYTDEFQDQHTRAVVLKGGSSYYAHGSSWYFPNALRLNLHQKMFLMSPGWERAGTLGFRCVADSIPV